jgi:hypothetical protein
LSDYAYKERVAIKMDSHICERDAINQTKREMEEPECVLKAKALQDRVRHERAERALKRENRFNYKE